MRRLSILSILLGLVAACGRPESGPREAVPPVVEAPAVARDAAPAAVAVVPIDAAAVVDAPPGPPPDAAPAIATWPFTAWDRAEAITFNNLPYGPRIPLYAYDAEHGWSPHLVDRLPITAAQGARAVDWVIETRGEVEVSKCPFPRHAVVLYAGDTPVGTVNVCFECGDILVWPAFEALPTSDKKLEKLYKRKLEAYDRVFPRWQAFFRDELGLSITPPPK